MISDYTQYPFQDIFDYSKYVIIPTPSHYVPLSSDCLFSSLNRFAVFVSEAELPNLVVILRSISDKQLAEMHAALIVARKAIAGYALTYVNATDYYGQRVPGSERIALPRMISAGDIAVRSLAYHWPLMDWETFHTKHK